MDKEFKRAFGFLIFLSVVSTVLLDALAGIPFLSRDFIAGFPPFLLLLTPYILFSSRFLVNALRDWISGSFPKQLLLPLYLLLTYTIFSAYSSNFQWVLFAKLALWFFAPVLLFSGGAWKAGGIPIRESIAALILWMPIEFGALPGFDIVFNPNITIPALPFAAPVLGLYLFVILRDLPDVGFTFTLTRKDFLTALAGIAVLALLLVPLGTGMGFIRASAPQTSPMKMVELLLGIYFLVAIPEELLFRGIIQNLLAKHLPGKYAPFAALALASVIFGFSHWNNFNPADWRYVFLASVAGMVYGTVYLKTGKTTASALVHCGVNFFWAVIFYGTAG